MDPINNEAEVYEKLLSQSLQMYDSHEELSVIDMAIRLMDNPEVPMHCPFHHFIVPAVLLTASAKTSGIPSTKLDVDLHEALKRSKLVIGGSCGIYGSCGAGGGMGIFMSIFTDTTPMSVETWSWANKATGLCLQEISKIEGPRCCKRVVFITLTTAVPYIKEKLNISLSPIDQIQCKYYQRNNDCKKQLCPFYPN